MNSGCALEAVWQCLIDKSPALSCLSGIHIYLVRGDVTPDKLSQSALRGKDKEAGVVRKVCLREKLLYWAYSTYGASGFLRQYLSSVAQYHNTWPSFKMLADVDAGKYKQSWDSTWGQQLVMPMDKALCDFAKDLFSCKVDKAICEAPKVV